MKRVERAYFVIFIQPSKDVLRGPTKLVTGAATGVCGLFHVPGGDGLRPSSPAMVQLIHAVG